MSTIAAALTPDVAQRWLADAERTDLSALVDTQRYPLHDFQDARLQAEIARAREDLNREGCAVLRGFLRPEALAQARQEGEQMSAKSYYSSRRVNAWFTSDDTTLDESDPHLHGAHQRFRDTRFDPCRCRDSSALCVTGDEAPGGRVPW